MTRQPLVSVNIPAYNSERFIAETIESVLNQTYRNLEVIVVDDGSADRTSEIVEAIARRDSRVRLICQSNRGVALTRNRAIEASAGDFIATLDADDLWAPQKLEKQVDCLTSSGPEVGAVYSWCLHIDEEDRPTGGYSANNEEGDVYLVALCYNIVSCGSNWMIRRECFSTCGGFRPGIIIDDRELCLRLAERYDFRVLPEFLVAYRQVKASSSYDHRRMVREYKSVMQDALRRHPGIPSQVCRWAYGVFYSYVATRSAAGGNFAWAFVYLMRATLNDPSILLRIPSYLKIKAQQVFAGRRLLGDLEPRSLATAPGTGEERPWTDLVNALPDPDRSPLGVFRQQRRKFMKEHPLRQAP
ncbi:MAG: glycosyltransferase family 2 protein [Erythrobacter sp.]|nr:glycosyltransferase family 2 protein [Erythrobacter sp.]